MSVFIGPKRKHEDVGRDESLDEKATRLAYAEHRPIHRPGYPYLKSEPEFCEDMRSAVQECRESPAECDEATRARLKELHERYARRCRFTKTFEGGALSLDGGYGTLSRYLIGPRLYRGVWGLDEIFEGASVGGPHHEKYMTTLENYAMYYPYMQAMKRPTEAKSTFSAIITMDTPALSKLGIFTGDSDDTHKLARANTYYASTGVQAMSIKADIALRLAHMGFTTASAAMSSAAVKEVRWIPHAGVTWSQFARTITRVVAFRSSAVKRKLDSYEDWNAAYYAQTYENTGTDFADTFEWGVDNKSSKAALALYPEEVRKAFGSLNKAHAP